MALSFQDSLALTQIASGEESMATPGYGAPTPQEIATYNNLANPDNIIEYSKDYLVFDVFNDSNVSVIDISKSVKVQSDQLNITQEKNSQYIPFSLSRKSDGYDLYNGVIWIVTDAGTKENDKAPYAVAPVNVYATEDKIYFGWLIDDWITRKSGQINFEIHVHGQVQGKDGTDVVTRGYIWKSKPGSLNVTASKLNLDEVVEENYNENWVKDIIAAAAENIAFETVAEQVNIATAAGAEAERARDEALDAANTATNAVNGFDAHVEVVKGDIVTLAETEVRKQIEDKVREITWDQEIPVILGYEYTLEEDENGHISSISISVADYVSQELSNYYTKEETWTKEEIQTAIDGVDVTEELNDLRDEISLTYATKSALNDYYTKEQANSAIQTAIDSADIEGKLTEYAKTTDVNSQIEARLGLGTLDKTMTQYVNEKVASVDVSEQLAEYTPLTRLGELGTVVDETTGEERPKTVEEAIASINVTDQLADYAKKDYVDTEVSNLRTSVNTNTESISKTNTQLIAAQQSIKNLEESAADIFTYGVTYEPTDGTFAFYEYTDEENQAEDETYEPKAKFTITGGSGGGGGGSSLKIEYITTTPLIVTTNDKAVINYKFTGVDSAGDDIGDATATWKVGGKVVKTETIVTGENTFDVTDYLTIGSQKVNLSVVDESGSVATKAWTVQLVNVYLESDFKDSSVYSGDVAFTFTPYGAISKVVHFILDGKEIATQTTSASGLSVGQTIPAQSHGSHLLEVYMTAEISGKSIESNHIFKDIMWFDEAVGTPIISCVNQEFTARQYETTNLTYTVYDPSTETPTVTLVASYVDENGETVVESTSTQTLTSGTQTWSYKTSVLGEHTLTITCRNTIKTLKATVVELGINVEPVTAGLVFDFDPTGYSNNDANRLWSDGDIKMTVSDNFDWINGGYQLDENGDQYFLIKAGTSAEINYELFGDDAKLNGKEFKLIFETKNVSNPDAVFLSCLSDTIGTDKIGLEMKVHEATIYAKVESLPLPYAEEEILEFEFNISNKEAAIPAVEGYEDGVMTRPMVYDDTHEFQQYQGYRKYISLGSTDCDLRIYRFKVYNKGLSDSDILNNFISDARSAEEMLSRYDRNQIYVEGALDPKHLAEMCPDVRVILIDCPHFTNDKSDYVGGTNIECIYKNGDPVYDNWTTTDCVHSGQGTSSNNYGPSGRNMDLIMKKFSKKGVAYNSDPHIYLGDGTEVTKVSLTRESIPVNYFNIKVNIASSENANNALLQRRYNEYNPYKRPFVRQGDSLEDHFSAEEIASMTEDQKTTLLAEYQAKANAIIPYIKDTMEFQNCIIFVREYDTDLSTHREFNDNDWHFYAIGNIGDSKKTDDTRLTDPTDPYECIIEVMDNTMPLSTFPTGYTNEDGSPKFPITVDQWETLDNPAYSALYYEVFDEESGLNEDGSLNKPNGLDDTYGMRYRWEEGSDEENDAAWEYVKNKWKEFYKFIVTSSDEEFKEQLGDYVVLDSILYYYLFTLRYTMTDNHAKNCFWHYGKSPDLDSDGNPIRKWDLCFDYDNDTALGIDNYGRMSYRYGYEEIDYVDGTSDWVWNAPQHVFFMRIRQLFDAELSSLYTTLESKGAWSAENLIKTFNESQMQWPEELWRVDINRKYKRTYTGSYINGPAYPEFYKERANGRKKSQRAQFERNQEKYMSSKFGSNVAAADDIILRCSVPNTELAVPANFDLTLTPYSYMYLNVKYNTATPVKVRAVPNQEYVIEYKADLADIIEIYSASCLRSIGDLSACYLINGSFANATKIRELVLGSSVEGYNNTNSMTLGLGANDLLNKLDIQNMSGLTQSLDLSTLKNLKELYAYGTSTSGIIFADGGLLEYVEIPDIASLSMKNLGYLDDEDFNIIGYNTLSTLVAENSLLDLISIINSSPNLYRIRLTGINWNLGEDGITLLERLYQMTGVTSTGYNSEQSVLAGYVWVPVIEEYQLYRFQEAWPDLVIEYGSMKKQHPVYFVNEDGTVLDTQYIIMGEYAVDPLEREENPIATPTKESTVSTYFTFSGWDIDFSELPILEPLTVTATYTPALRTYTIKYVSKGVVLETKTGLYGENILYSGDIPTYTGQEAAYNYQLFNRWDKSGFLTEGPDGTDFVDGVKTVNAIYDEFQFTTSAFRGKELADLTPVEIYALTRMGLDNVDIGQLDEKTGSYEGLQKGDPYSFTMGYDVDYNDVESVELISEPRTFTGAKNDYLDTGIQLLNDRDFVLAIDFNMSSGASAASVLAQCYNSYNSVGFQLSYSSGVSLKWGSTPTSSKIATPGKREILVLRHIKGDKNLYIYSSDLDNLEPLVQEISSTKEGVYDNTLVFGCKKEDDGSYGNYCVGDIFWSKIWFADLGDSVCRKLVGWTHEEIKLAIDGMKRYYISNSSKRTTFSLMGTQLLDRKRVAKSSGINEGGYPTFNFFDILNTRFYNAMPVQIQALTKQVNAGYTVGGNTNEVAKGDFYVLIPSMYDVGGSVNTTQTEHFVSEAGGDEGNRTDIINNETRKRFSADGTIDSYWLRSTLYYPQQTGTYYSQLVYSVNKNGEFEDWTNVTASHGILIEISF